MRSSDFANLQLNPTVPGDVLQVIVNDVSDDHWVDFEVVDDREQEND